MSNLARKYQNLPKTEPKINEQNKQLTRKTWFTPGEKIIGFAFAGLLCFGALQIISNQSHVYQVNKDIQDVQTSIKDIQKVNADLKVQVSELSKYDRIYEKAKKMGLELNENHIKVVQEK